LNDVSLIVEGESLGQPGNSSYTIVNGGLVFLEIFDQAPELERKFTQRAYKEISAELYDVLRHRDQVDARGIFPGSDHYPKPLPKHRHFEVKDRAPGIYLVDAAINPTEAGIAYIKAFKVDTGEQLSEEQTKLVSTRHVGWSDDGGTYFAYSSEVVIYEGDSDSTYQARFELWHRSGKAIEAKLAESTRTINGWER
jgi:hypothetical protein